MMRDMAVTKKQQRDLYKLFASIKSEKEAEDLLIDLLAPHEIDFLSERWAIMTSIYEGKTQRQTVKDLKTSMAKVSRCARVVKYGEGAIAIFAKRLSK